MWIRPHGCKQEEWSQGRYVPLTKTRYCVLGVDLVALRRETPWGVRVEYVDLTLKRPVYACYTPAFPPRPG